MASVRTRLGYRAWVRGDVELAGRLAAESQRDARDQFPLIEAQNALLHAHLALVDDRLDDAEASLDRSHELASSLNWAWYESVIGHVHLDLALRRGDLDEAEHQGYAALAIAVEDEYVLAAVHAITGLARVALARDDLERAGLLWGAVSGQGERRLGIYARRWGDDLREETRPAFLAAFARGRELELREGAAIALGVNEIAHTVP